MIGSSLKSRLHGHFYKLWSNYDWLVVATCLWLVRYATLDFIPFWHEPVWHPWFDQSRYFSSAMAFFQGDLSPAAHWYPLSYPLLASPFACLVPRDPFFLLDLILFLVTCRAFQKVCAAFDIGQWPATLCFLATTLIVTPLASAWTTPWSTTLSAALSWWLIAMTISLSKSHLSFSSRRYFALGASVSALPLVRPLDLVLSITFAALIFVVLIRTKQLTMRVIGPALSGAVVTIALYGGLHIAIYGGHPTRYMIASAQMGFVPSDLGWKAYVLLINPRPWFPDSKAILETIPWILPGLAGLIVTVMRGDTTQRYVVGLLLVLALPISTLMLTYTDLQPPGLWYFGNIHYFKWTMPIWGLGVLLFWRLLKVRAARPALIGVMLLLLLPLGLRIVPVPVSDDVPARMLLFAGATNRNYEEAYFSPSMVRDSVGQLHNVSGFHQIPDQRGERAIAIRRLFDGHAERYDPGETSIEGWRTPYARYAERIFFAGLPLTSQPTLGPHGLPKTEKGNGQANQAGGRPEQQDQLRPER